MNEAEWLACDDPKSLPSSFWDTIAERKVRLFAVWCCRRVRHLRPSEWPGFLELAERRAEGEVAETGPPVPGPDHGSARHFDNATRAAALPDIRANIREVCHSAALVRGCAAYHVWGEDDGVSTDAMMDARRAEAAEQMEALRHIVGDPFHSVTFDPAWRTASSLALANAASDGRAWETLPVLADSLEDAGCDNADILAHLRGPGPHVRGCWALDLVLGKS